MVNKYIQVSLEIVRKIYVMKVYSHFQIKAILYKAQFYSNYAEEKQF